MKAWYRSQLQSFKARGCRGQTVSLTHRLASWEALFPVALASKGLHSHRLYPPVPEGSENAAHTPVLTVTFTSHPLVYVCVPPLFRIFSRRLQISASRLCLYRGHRSAELGVHAACGSGPGLKEGYNPHPLLQLRRPSGLIAKKDKLVPGTQGPSTAPNTE